MMDELQTGLALLGLKLINAVVAAFTSFAALQFFDKLSTRDKWTTFLGGWSLAAWGAAPLSAWLELKPTVEVGVVLVLGLFGMALAAEIIKIIRFTDWRGLLERIIQRKTGN